MTDEDRLRELVRTTMVRSADVTPARDLWPLVKGRAERPEAWSRLDIGLAAISVVALLVFPEWLLLLAYHL